MLCYLRKYNMPLYHIAPHSRACTYIRKCSMVNALQSEAKYLVFGGCKKSSATYISACHCRGTLNPQCSDFEYIFECYVPRCTALFPSPLKMTAPALLEDVPCHSHATTIQRWITSFSAIVNSRVVRDVQTKQRATTIPMRRWTTTFVSTQASAWIVTAYA